MARASRLGFSGSGGGGDEDGGASGPEDPSEDPEVYSGSYCGPGNCGRAGGTGAACGAAAGWLRGTGAAGVGSPTNRLSTNGRACAMAASHDCGLPPAAGAGGGPSCSMAASHEGKPKTFSGEASGGGG